MPDSANEKNAAVAYALAIGVPLAAFTAGVSISIMTQALGPGLLMVMGGVVVAPSLGQYYAGSPNQASTGLA